MENDRKSLDIFTSLDLEMNQPSRKIVEIGAVIGNIRTGDILETIKIRVNPFEKINPEITELTGIKQEDIDNGETLESAYRKLEFAHQRHRSFMNCITWGGEDAAELLEQLQKENPNFHGWCFGRRCIDVKTLVVSYKIAKKQQIQGGLKNSCRKFKVPFEGPAHRAEKDAFNTFNLFRHLINQIDKCGI